MLCPYRLIPNFQPCPVQSGGIVTSGILVTINQAQSPQKFLLFNGCYCIFELRYILQQFSCPTSIINTPKFIDWVVCRYLPFMNLSEQHILIQVPFLAMIDVVSIPRGPSSYSFSSYKMVHISSMISVNQTNIFILVQLL